MLFHPLTLSLIMSFVDPLDEFTSKTLVLPELVSSELLLLTQMTLTALNLVSLFVFVRLYVMKLMYFHPLILLLMMSFVAPLHEFMSNTLVLPLLLSLELLVLTQKMPTAFFLASLFVFASLLYVVKLKYFQPLILSLMMSLVAPLHEFSSYTLVMKLALDKIALLVRMPKYPPNYDDGAAPTTSIDTDDVLAFKGVGGSESVPVRDAQALGDVAGHVRRHQSCLRSRCMRALLVSSGGATGWVTTQQALPR